ncbi:hypothetical protein V5O48_013129 [Marasmius crinis-equi]|uniref:Uncharacterized protein n=1 Tax=Marasmius crinis-equi TaxID=585013 RepID=A0ABR3F189_9AGAR
MPGPASGVYHIKNVKTGFWLTKEFIDAGSDVWSEKENPAVCLCVLNISALTANMPSKNFQISEDGGVYGIVERTKGLSVGAHIDGERHLVWRRTVYTWFISEIAPGIWSIGTPMDNAYWHDTSHLEPEGRGVVLSEFSMDDSNSWELVAAAL